MTTNFEGWEAAPEERMSIVGDEVHVVWAALDVPARRVEVMEGLLSADERVRAARFVFARDRDRFVAGRGTLRRLLGAYVDVAPAALEFRYGPHGKPSLAGRAGPDIRFNVSHSEGHALYAIALGREVGVDVERIKPLPDAAAIAGHYFSPREVAALLSLSEPERQPAFFACWTRKESYLKATGDGLGRSLDGFDVSLLPGLPARLERVEGDPLEPGRWSLAELRPAPGYAAAVAVEGSIGRLRCREWKGAEPRARPATPGRAGGTEHLEAT